MWTAVEVGLMVRIVGFACALESFLQLSSSELHSLKRENTCQWAVCNARRENSGKWPDFFYERINCFVLVVEDCLAMKTNGWQLHVSIVINFKNVMLSKNTKLFMQILDIVLYGAYK